MLEKLFGAYTEAASWTGGPAFDRLIEAIRAHAGIDEALSAYTFAAELAAYQAGFSDGVAVMEEAAANRRQRAG